MKVKKVVAVVLAAAMSLSMMACGKTKEDQPTKTQKKDSIVNVGCTSALDTLNPLVMDASWINVYAIGLEFLPLVSQGNNNEFVNVLASKIASADNKTYEVTIDPKAKWSDGQPVTAEDLEFTIMRLASPKVMSSIIVTSGILGTDDESGLLKEGATSMEGLRVIDEHTLAITFKQEMNMTGFLNGYAQYIMPVPKHVLEKIPEKELAKSSWFDKPSVVSGPYQVEKYDSNHFISFKSNENYWKGAPKIDYCNFKIVDSSQLLSNLKSGEIDIIPPLLGAIPEQDYKAVKSIPGVRTKDGLAITTESLFLNGKKIPDVKVRQALLYALDREKIAKGLVGNDAQLMDGFCVPDGPYYSGEKAVAYNPQKAKQLLKEAKWDSQQKLSFHIDSGNGALKKAATLCQNYWKQVGINVDIVTEGLDTLVAGGGSDKTDILGVQYTYPIMAPSFDVDWGLENWCHMYPESIKKNIQTIWTTNDEQEQKKNYEEIDAFAREQVPVICLYAHGPLGAVSTKLNNAEPTTYGFTNNIQEWSFQ